MEMYIEEGTIEYINEFKGEFHYDKLKHTSDLVDDINYVHDYFNENNITFQRWEVGYKLGLVDYKLGTKPEPMMAPVVEEKKETGEVQDLSYTELRARLPQEISNEIVMLLANSKQALLDFANIQTGEDVANFNQQYDVNLTLPQGA